MTDHAEETTPEIVLFSEFLGTFKKGVVDAELTAMLREVTTAVRSEQKKGTVSLKLTVAPAKGVEDNQLLIAVEKLDSTVPQPTRANTFYYATDQGDLVKDDPRQTSLFTNKESKSQ